VPFYFGGTSLLIAVGVALDTVSQVESHLVTRSYEGFFEKRQIKRTTGLKQDILWTLFSSKCDAQPH